MTPEPDRIAPDADHPFYWRFRGRTAPLLGGSSEDNLFQVPDVEPELDRIRQAGGNFVRCTMSSRDDGDVWPFHQLDDGRYDLDRSAAAYWDRVSRFMHATFDRAIVVQVELWDRFDFGREPWLANPFNPANNVNYTAAESGLETAYPLHPGKTDQPFFRSVPALDDNRLLLRYQQALVDRLLEITLPFDHVLYCIDNETHVRPEWGAYWARYVQAKAAERGVRAYTTEMWDAWDITSPTHDATFLDPQTYPFIDCSQNNQQRGQPHYDHLLHRRRQLIERGLVRPMNNVKVYGGDGGPHGSTRDGLERFWKAIFGGVAAARFHRPPTGLGSTDLALTHVRAARLVTDTIDAPRCEPRPDLLHARQDDAAYCLAAAGRAYAVYFPRPGRVELDRAALEGDAQLRWLDLAACAFSPGQEVPSDARLTLEAEHDHAVALITGAA